MTHRDPPRAAAWLLDRFVGENQALVGDMLQEYRAGRSGPWYWRQAVIASLRSTVAEIQSHWILALRALILGWVYCVFFTYCILRPFVQLYADVLWKVDPYLSTRGLGFGVFLGVFLRDFPAELLAPCLGVAVGSWIVARLHRPHQGAITLMNAAALFVVETFQFIVGVIRYFNFYFDFIERHPKAALGPHNVYVYLPLCLGAFQVILLVFSAIAGGLWKAPRDC